MKQFLVRKKVYVKRLSEIVQDSVKEEGARNVAIQWLIDQKSGAMNFAMRRFSIKMDGNTPLHSHDWEHEVYVLSGKGTVRLGDEVQNLEKDMFAYVPPNTVHQFKNTSNEVFTFLCITKLKK